MLLHFMWILLYTAAQLLLAHTQTFGTLVYGISYSYTYIKHHHPNFLIFLLFIHIFLLPDKNTKVYVPRNVSYCTLRCRQYRTVFTFIYATYASLGDLFPCLIDRKVASSRLLFIYVLMCLLMLGIAIHSSVSYQGHKPTLFSIANIGNNMFWYYTYKDTRIF